MKNVNMQNNYHFTDHGGFTLIEVLVAMVILSIGIFALYSMQISSVRTNYFAGSLSQAANYSSSQLETLLQLIYNDELISKRKDGKPIRKYKNASATDPNYGVSADNFGLDNVAENTADHWRKTEDRRFTMTYNVVEDFPIKGIKKIRAHTQDNAPGSRRPVVFDLLKNDNI
ncbi:type IV pilus modification PilV family protein [Desulfobulbus oralis]|uniref:Prepilin-type N-terminal cleavage/methylation domain-containing protein n=1 Tax=Desulfobulbus oralis TaxID=1986146 RepID=A0A2L1GQQ7_9BACT|nr:prepilin-type N-terminal cleavage/methylation domain-containing protein [Desulfobulbus oralis]AVD71990.1 hypothetical protein CAY53_11320 [Desulfobulbus oralis]